ncbi:MAG: T9SS type A sorting domain-containing protein [Saprospiraceae bacterium]|nr:T9SS type A sorting domain-containing protein [Saprospiraceae bacterium]
MKNYLLPKGVYFLYINIMFYILLILDVKAQWVTVGNTTGFSSGAVEYTSLAFSGSTPYIAFSDGTQSGKSTVMKYDGTNWITVGTAGFSSNSAYSISLAFDGTTPYIVYQNGGSGQKAIVMMYNGSNWVSVGGIMGFSSGAVDYTSIVFNGTTPYVVYKDLANSNKATVMKYNGSSWVTVGTAGFSAGAADFVSLAFNGTTPYVAYRDATNSNKVTVKMYDGSNWVTVGTAGFSAGIANSISLAFNGVVPYVAYKDFVNSNKVTVKMYDGSNWVTVGSAGFSTGTADYVSLAFNGTIPYVAYMENAGTSGSATVKMYDGSSWVTVGTAGFSAGTAYYLSFVLANSIPYVCYQDGANFFKATAMKYNATLPIELKKFEGQYENSKVALKWEVFSPLFSCKEFQIERSSDGINFIKIASIKATDSQINYNFLDSEKHSQINFYRLKIEDKTGAFFHSRVISINIPNTDEFDVCHTNITGVFTILTNNDNLYKELYVRVFNIMGQQILATKGTTLDLSSMPVGIYMVLIQQNGKHFLRKFMR